MKYKRAKRGPTPRQKRFVELFVASENATEAFLQAGYKEQATRQLTTAAAYKVVHAPAVQELLSEIREKAAGKLDLRMMRVLAEVYSIAFSDIAAFIDKKTGEIRDIHDIPRMARGAIRKLKRTERREKNGDTIVTSEIELYDKLRPLEKMMELVGLQEGVDPDTGRKSQSLVNIRITLPDGEVLKDATG